MKSLKLLGVALAAVAGPVLANDIPVPSFNDTPELYAHPAPGASSRGGSSSSVPAPMDYGPWIVIPSSGD